MLLSPAYRPDRPKPARVEATARPPDAFKASRRVGAWAADSVLIVVLSWNGEMWRRTGGWDVNIGRRWDSLELSGPAAAAGKGNPDCAAGTMRIDCAIRSCRI